MSLEPTDLLGTWRLARVIDDRLTDERSTVTGTLNLAVVDPDRIAWEESGRWMHRGGAVDVRRGLWLVRLDADDASSWEVRFEDDQVFHSWSPGEQVVHPCAPDTYRGLVEGTPAAWTITWEASGPAKDYRMVTSLTR